MNILLMLVSYSLTMLYLIRDAQIQARRERHRTLAEVREMLSDTILNDLAIASLNTQLSKGNPRNNDRVMQALKRIEQRVRGLSDAELDSWFAHYQQDRILEINPAEKTGS